MTEHEIQNAILRRFATVSWLRLERINVGVYKTLDGDRIVRVGVKGKPDISGHVVGSGRRIDIEVKTETGRLSVEQVAYGRMLARTGPIYMVARSVGDVERALRLEGYGDLIDGDAAGKT